MMTKEEQLTRTLIDQATRPLRQQIARLERDVRRLKSELNQTKTAVNQIKRG